MGRHWLWHEHEHRPRYRFAHATKDLEVCHLHPLLQSNARRNASLVRQEKERESRAGSPADDGNEKARTSLSPILHAVVWLISASKSSHLFRRFGSKRSSLWTCSGTARGNVIGAFVRKWHNIPQTIHECYTKLERACHNFSWNYESFMFYETVLGSRNIKEKLLSPW